MLANLALILWPTDVANLCLTNQNTTIVGVAYSTTNQLLYCEQVSILSEKQLHIDYLLENKIFATKDLIIVTTPDKPEVIQKDFRSGEVRQAIVTQENIGLHYQENKNKKEDYSNLKSNDVDVVDAGFDEFIRNHWQDFSSEKGKYLTLRFASIAHLRSLNLRIHLEDLAVCKKNLLSQIHDTHTVSNGDLERCYLVEIDNFLLRLLLGKMQLMYDKQHRLRNYLGPVNIADTQGKTQNASIDYYYVLDYLKP